MNRKELVDHVARTAEMSVADAETAVSAVLEGVIGAVAGQDKVTLAGFGTFEARHRQARSGRNPQTGETIEIAASIAPAFKPAAAFKQAVSGR